MRPPPVGGDRQCFDEVRSYREAVVRLSLATVAAIALHAESLDEAVRATHADGDVNTLFRLAMQFQIVDDVVDFGEDLSAGLPSFLTASRSRPQALALTADAARSYGASGGSSGAGVLPLRLALEGITALTILVVRAARRGDLLHLLDTHQRRA
jgi:hypothetical protein